MPKGLFVCDFRIFFSKFWNRILERRIKFQIVFAHAKKRRRLDLIASVIWFSNSYNLASLVQTKVDSKCKS